MKRLQIILIACLISAGSAFAQEGRSGIKGGLNLSNLSMDGSNDKNMRVGFHIGAFTSFDLAGNFAIQPELLYSQRGTKYDYDGVLLDSEVTYNFGYLDLPVYLVYNLSEDFNFKFGPYVGYMITANAESDNNFLGFEFSGSEELNPASFNRLDAGLSLGLGFEPGSFIFGFNYNIGLTKIGKEGEDTGMLLGDARNSLIQVYAGFKF
ncbi:MAG: porin family protein [Cyclobacteriaceae bacterium]